MLKILLILALGLVPPLLSLWGIRRAEARAQERLRRILARTTAPNLPLSWRSPQPIDPLTGTIGDLSCRYNARSALLRCAINPLGPCETCSHYEAREKEPVLFS